MRKTVLTATVTAIISILLLSGAAQCASVKPLEIFSQRIVAVEVVRLANEHAIAAALVRNSLDSLNKGMNIMSQKQTEVSLKLLTASRQAVADSERSALALRGYINASRPQLKEGGHERFLPLARLYEEIEKPYNASLERFLATASDFIQFCSENHDAVSTGQAVEASRYDALYGAYLRDMEAFNMQSVKRTERIADWTAEYPAIMELLPR